MSTTEQQATSNLAVFTVNGEELQAPKGMNLLRALCNAGYEVPHYCYHPALSVAGSCRLCFVQMEGDPRLHASCNMKVGDGLKILTETPAIHEARAGMMEFLLVNHPLDCPVCDKGGECMLQRYSMDHGISEARTDDVRRRFEKPQFDPLIDLERNRCILCSRCVRFCDEMGENHVLGIVERGDRNRIASFGNGTISSIFSGNIVDICPVGALTSKPFRFRARTWEMQQIVTSCAYCSAGCAMTAWARDGKVYRVTTPVVRKGAEFGLNEDTADFICNQGRFGSDFGHSETRVLAAQVRKNGTLAPVALDEAIGVAARALREVAEKHGPEAVAFLAGPRATNEELFLLQKIAREAIGSPNIDWRLHLADRAACEAHSAALAAADGTLEDLERVECVLVIEADLLHATPVLALKIKEAAKQRKNKTVLIGAALDEFVGKYAAQRIVGQPDEVLGLLEKMAAGDAAANGHANVNAVLELLVQVKSGLIVFGLSEQSGANLPRLVAAVQALAARLGDGWKTLPVAAERNAMGAFALGCQPDRQPGAALSGGGLTSPEILRAAADGKIKALYVLGQDLMRVAADRELLGKALDAVELLIVQDAFAGEAARRATVVLPGALFTEKDGVYTNADGHLARLVKGYAPPEGVLDEVSVLLQLVAALGQPLAYANAEQVFDGWLAAMKPELPFAFFDLTLDQPGAEWPVRARSYVRQKTRPDFAIRFAEKTRALPVSATSAEPKATAKGLAPHWSWNVSGGDHLGDQSPTMTRLRPQAPAVYLNAGTAAELGLCEGQAIHISCVGGAGMAVKAILHTSENVAAGLLHFAMNDLPAEMTRQALVLSPAGE